jgi:cytochrome c553
VRHWALVILLAGCGQEPDPGAALERRRIALGLEDAPLSVKRAMVRLDKLDVEARLEQGAGLDLALTVENLLDRFEFEKEPGLLEASRAAARALVAGTGSAEDLLTSCAACHARHREER